MQRLSRIESPSLIVEIILVRFRQLMIVWFIFCSKFQFLRSTCKIGLLLPLTNLFQWIAIRYFLLYYHFNHSYSLLFIYIQLTSLPVNDFILFVIIIYCLSLYRIDRKYKCLLSFQTLLGSGHMIHISRVITTHDQH